MGAQPANAQSSGVCACTCRADLLVLPPHLRQPSVGLPLGKLQRQSCPLLGRRSRPGRQFQPPSRPSNRPQLPVPLCQPLTQNTPQVKGTRLPLWPRPVRQGQTLLGSRQPQLRAVKGTGRLCERVGVVPS